VAAAEFPYAEALRILAARASVDLDPVLARACPPGGDPVVYLADLSRQTLQPLSASLPAEQVTGTLAGRAFTSGQPVSSVRDGQARIWVPVLEQTARIGVLAVTLPDDGPAYLRQAELLGVFAGIILGGMNRVSDTPHIRRRAGHGVSLPASMQWDMLPPWSVRVRGGHAAGMLEPAYDIAGDAFDYAADDDTLHFAIIDGMGHGIGSTLLADLAVGAYRHARRAGSPLADMHTAIDESMTEVYDDLSFATGILGTLALGTGRLEWTCAGHPRPLLLRGRKVVAAELDSDATLPFGLGTGTPAVAARDLEPGDSVLLYTDGVIDAHTPDGDLFGLERLVDLLEQQAAGEQEPEELLRRVVGAVLEHQGGHLRDDATLVLLRWAGA
jgi:serine/threonine protein phosphatase PrpC